MYENLLFLLSQVGFDGDFESFLRWFEFTDLESLKEEHTLSSDEWDYLGRMKEYLLKETQMSEVDVAGFMAYMFIPRKMKTHPEYRCFDPEAVLDIIFHESHPKLTVVDEER